MICWDNVKWLDAIVHRGYCVHPAVGGVAKVSIGVFTHLVVLLASCCHFADTLPARRVGRRKNDPSRTGDGGIDRALDDRNPFQTTVVNYPGSQPGWFRANG